MTVLILIISSDLGAQDKIIEFYPTAGITWRSTAMNFFNFGAVIPDDYTRPYDYERNVQGVSLNIGLQVQFLDHLTLEYYPNLRYDVLYVEFDPAGKEFIRLINGDSLFFNDKVIYIKDFIIDHNWNLSYKKKLTYGVGISIVNANKVYTFYNPPTLKRYHNIEFKTYNAFIVIPIKKILNLEIKAMYIPRDFPENPNEEYMMYSLRLYYKFDFLKKKKID